MGFWEDQLARVDDAEAKATFQAALEKVPAIRDDIPKGYLRQDEFSRKLNEFGEVDKKFKEADTKVKEWESWRTQAWDPERNMTKQEARLLAEAETLRNQNALLEAAGGEDVDFKKLEEIVQSTIEKAPFVRSEQIAAAVKAALPAAGVLDAKSYVEDVSQKFAAFGGAAESLMSVGTKLAIQHALDYREALDLQPLLAEVGKSGRKLEEVYSDHVADRRAAADKEKHQKEIDDAVKAAVEKVRQEQAMSPGALPVDTAGPAGIGPLQTLVDAKAKGEKNGSEMLGGTSELGTFVTAREMAADYIKKSTNPNG